MARPVALIARIGELRLEPGQLAWAPEQLGPQVQIAEILIGIARLEVRADVVDESVTAGIVERDAPGELVLDDRPRQHQRRAPRRIAAELGQEAGFRGEGRVLGVDDDRAGDGVGALRGRLRPAEDLDALDVPGRGRAEIELVVAEIVAVDIDRRARHRSAPERVLAGERALRVLAADDRGADRVGVGHVRRADQDLGHGRVAGVCPGDVLVGDDRDRRGGVPEVPLDLLAGDRDRIELDRPRRRCWIALREGRRRSGDGDERCEAHAAHQDKLGRHDVPHHPIKSRWLGTRPWLARSH